MNTTVFSGDSNRGLQLASNSGQVLVNFHGQTEPSPTKPQPSSTVPFRRDPDFVDRGILAEIGEKCSKPASRVALVGLGGVGKSQLAIEYSYRITDQFPQTWIFWIHASNAARFEEGYRMIADKVELPRRDEPKADILQLVSNWLCDKTSGQWIMILDNADDSAVFLDPRGGSLKSDTGELDAGAVSLSSFLPQSQNGSILVTSRSEETALRLTGRHHDIIKVEPMNESHALVLFQKKLRGEFNEGDAIELLRVLDHMPLAISQAAAYINQRAPRTTVARYLNDFRKSDRNQANLLNRDVGDLRRDSRASNSIITTWQISFEYIRIKKPSAARLLSLMSFFDRQGIPESLLRCYNDREDSGDIDLKNKDDIDLENDPDMDFEDDVSTLISFSLIMTNVEENQFEMHRLVQFSTRKWLELSGGLETWKKKYIKIISDAFPSGEYENWTICQILYPHAAAMLACRPTETQYLIYWSEVLRNAGWYALLQGNYLTAEKMYHHVLDGVEKALGKEHLATLTSVNNLAVVLQSQGKYEAAEEMNRRALEGYEKALGREHPYTLTSVSNLALVLENLGKYEVAEKMNQQALEGREKALGKEHPQTLSSVSNLALVLNKQGKYEAAEPMNQRVLEEYEKALGREHPHTLTSVSNLALVLNKQGKYEAAEKMNRLALEGREKELGKEHPDTLTSVSNLASLLQDLGKYEAAEEMNRRALEGYEKALGREHPHTLTSVSNLALVLKNLGKYEVAEKMNQQALEGREKALGKEHPDTLTSVSHLAGVLEKQGKYEAAEKMNRRALEGYEKALGREHRYTLTSVNNLALVLEKQGKYEAAEKMNRRALEGYEKALGKEHPYTLTSVSWLAYLLHRQKQYKDARALYARSYTGFRKVLGVNHPETLVWYENYSSIIEEMELDGTIDGKHRRSRTRSLSSSRKRRRIRRNSLQ